MACPGINDGEELLRTFNDLETLGVELVAVVPVGLTRYREGLYPLVEYTKQTARQTLDFIEKYGDECKKKCGRRTFYASDEFYIIAEKQIPDAEFYEDFCALEDGIGMIAFLKDDVTYALEEYDFDDTKSHTVTVACGTGVAPFMREIMDIINVKFPNIKINVTPIVNNFFGGGVNVSGLVTGQDLIAQLKGVELGERLLIPSSMLRFENDLFLDDVSTEDVERELGIKLCPVNNNGDSLVSAVVMEGEDTDE